MSVVIVGSVAFDSIETANGSAERTLGGSATFASIAASPFSSVGVVGVVGDDFDETHVAFLKSKRVDLAGLERATGKTFHWAGRYSPDFSERETLTTDLNVFADFSPKLPGSYRDAEVVFLANIAPALQLRVLEQTTSPRLVVADTMNLWIDTQKDDLMSLIERVDTFILNDEEARMLTGERNLIRAGRALLTTGPSRVIIKKGEHGALSLTNEAFFCFPAYPVREVVDPTGAGDAFAGAFVGHLAAQDSFREEDARRAIVYGSVVASFVVEGFGVEAVKTLDRAAIDARYGELLSYATVS